MLRSTKFELTDPKRLLILTCIYNRLPLVRECVEAVLKNTKTTNLNVTFGLVYNYPPEPDVWNYLVSLIQRPARIIKTIILDPHENLGCHRGFNYGYKHLNAPAPDYVVKLDDDTIVPPGWNLPMMQLLDDDLNLAYISSIDKDARQGIDFKSEKIGKYHIEIPQRFNVGFSCVMFPARTLNQFGLLMDSKTLYGGEEEDYHLRVKAAGQYGAYIREVTAQHLKNDDRDIDYVAWKYWYGYMRATHLDLRGFKNDRRELIRCWEHMLTRKESWWQQQARKRLRELKGGFFKRLFNHNK